MQVFVFGPRLTKPHVLIGNPGGYPPHTTVAPHDPVSSKTISCLVKREHYSVAVRRQSPVFVGKQSFEGRPTLIEIAHPIFYGGFHPPTKFEF